MYRALAALVRRTEERERETLDDFNPAILSLLFAKYRRMSAIGVLLSSVRARARARCYE